MDSILDFDASAVVISLGLDTYDGDKIALRKAGFHLSGQDYFKMGQCIGEKARMPVVFIQEGGYKMDVVGQAVADVLSGFNSIDASE